MAASGENGSQNSLLNVPEAVYADTVEPVSYLDRAKQFALRMAAKAAVLATLVASVLLGFAISAVLIWRWIKYSIGLLFEAIFGKFGQMYGWLDEYSPSDTAEERTRKFETLRDRVKEIWASSIPYWQQFKSWVSMDFWDWLLVLTVVVVLGIGFRIVLRWLESSARYRIMQLRGIQLEAVRSGSEFQKSELPSGQVQIMIPGILFDEHQGYGIRVRDYLVTPAHVVERYQEVVLSVQGSKVLVPVNFVKSRLTSDLVYMYVGSNVFSRMAVPDTKAMRSFVSGFASCTGQQGMSTGRVSKSTIRGKLVYEGSTIPGMSGAPYMAQGSVVGLHQGAAGPVNLGISIEVIKAEIKRLVRVEAAYDGSPGGKRSDEVGNEYKTRFQGSSWTQEQLDRMADERYGRDGWAEEQELDYDQVFTWDDESAPGPSGRAPAMSIPAGVKVSGGFLQVPLDNHSPGGSQQLMDVLPATDLDYLQAMRKEHVLEWVQSRKAVKKEERPKQPPPVRQQHPCERCEVVCRTKERLASHIAATHAKIQPESAIHEDTGDSGKLVQVKKTGHFLGVKASTPNSGKRSSKNSRKLGGKKESHSMEEVLSRMMQSQQNIERCFEKFLGNMAGQSSVTMQS